VYSEYTILYSNEKLLNKYNKSIPKTWNELLTTAKYILEEEKKLNNTNIIGYNGLFHRKYKSNLYITIEIITIIIKNIIIIIIIIIIYLFIYFYFNFFFINIFFIFYILIFFF